MAVAPSGLERKDSVFSFPRRNLDSFLFNDRRAVTPAPPAVAEAAPWPLLTC